MATDLQVTTNKLSNKETQLTVKVPVEKIQNKGIGKTINDRLNRASKY